MSSKSSIRRTVRKVASRVAEAFAVTLIRTIRLVPLRILTAIAGRFGRLVGPLHPRNRIGLENLRLAFPEKSEAECRRILSGMWDNLFRTGVEYAKLDQIFDFDPDRPDAGKVTVSGRDRLLALRDDGKPGLIFTAHLGNWELLQIAAGRGGLDISSLYRPPNVGFIANVTERIRERAMHSLVTSRPGAVYDLMGVLERGGHVGLLVDQKFNNRRRVTVEFFGRAANANPLLAQLARRYECPVHGSRAIRGPNGTHHLEITDAIDLPRDSEGQIDVERATACVTGIVERWIREHPEQWLWIHKRWAI